MTQQSSSTENHTPISRRHFLGAALLLMSAANEAVASGRRPQIVLRSSWQTVNIGDIAHTPGVLHLLEKYLPNADVRLWPSNIGNGVEQLLRDRFPKLTFVKGNRDVQAAFEECDLLLHGSGPFLVAQRDVERWRKETGKPYGVYGITFTNNHYSTRPLAPEAIAKTVDVMNGARFVFFRDSPSLVLAKEMGCRAPVMEFAPDGAFATDLVDTKRADTFLAEHDLTPKQFLCCIPRHRYTPYWSIPERNTPFDSAKHEQNEQHVESDHLPLREAIIEVVQRSDMKVLLCPEDQTQMALGKTILWDRLPEDVRKHVVWRPDYWLTGEARSTYLRSAGLFGHEMHSPIMCIGAGIPAIVCRWKEQTSKGLMWKDIGLEDWLFDMDKPDDVKRIVPAVLKLATEPQWASEKTMRAQQFVEKRQQETMAILSKEISYGG